MGIFSACNQTEYTHFLFIMEKPDNKKFKYNPKLLLMTPDRAFDSLLLDFLIFTANTNGGVTINKGITREHIAEQMAENSIREELS